MVDISKFCCRILAHILRPTCFNKLYIKVMYCYKTGKYLNFKKPVTFCEKIQWLKLYNRNPQFTIMADKYAVKQFVAEKIGERYVVPTIGVWDRPSEINWDFLPNEFVLKSNCGGGNNGVVICTDKDSLNKDEAISKLEKSYKQSLYKVHREWPYKNIKRKIIAEELLKEYVNGERVNDLSDYKFYCFNGEPQYCQVIRGRSTKETIDFYDLDWKHMPFVGLNPKVYNGTTMVPKPSCLDEMLCICKKLCHNIPFLRIDLYLIQGKIYFGEITFFPSSGFGRFAPEEWDKKLGDLIQLPI